MNYKQLAKEILENVGGNHNIASVTHCATRLRFNLKEDKKANPEVLKDIKGVMGVVNKGGQFQVIIGSDVGSVYKELAELGSFSDEASGGGGEKKGIIINVLDTIAGIFTPIISAITGAGMLKAVLALLVTFKVLTPDNQVYMMLNIMSDAAFYFMPFLIANSAAKKFKCNPYMAMSIAGVLLHPNFIGMVSTAKEAGESIQFLGLPVTLATYSSSVIPIILGVWFMSFMEPIADKVSPKPVKFFTKPLLTLIIVAPVTFIVLGPLGSIMGNGIASGIEILNSYAGWLVPLIVGTFTPLLVMTGMHYGLIPIGINNLATVGFDTVVGPGMLGSNIAQGAAALCVALKSKNKEMKQLASSAGITAVCGITEPAMYGVNLKLKKPLIAAMIGGGVAGLYMGITGVGRFSAGSPGLLALPGYIGTEGFTNITNAVIGAAIAFVVSFGATWILGFDDGTKEKETKGNKEENKKNKENKTDNKDSNETSKLITHKENVIYSPIKGKTIPLNQVKDPAFSDEIMGKGIAIIPDRGRVTAPLDGVVSALFHTNHAIGITGTNGAQILIHVGMDTVKLEGKHFTAHVKANDIVKKGQLLLEFDKEAIIAEGFELITPVIISNTDDYGDVIGLTDKQVEEMDEIIKLI